MKKLVITLVIASLYSGATFADSKGRMVRQAEEAAQGLKGRDVVRPGQAKGAKVNAGGSVSTDRAGQTSNAGTSVAPNALAVSEKYNSCPVNSPLSKMGQGAQNSLQKSAVAGVAGSGCATHFESTQTASVVVEGAEAGTNKLLALGRNNVSEASKAEKLQVKQAMIAEYAKDLGVDAADATQRFENMCAQGCDHASAALCNIN